MPRGYAEPIETPQEDLETVILRAGRASIRFEPMAVQAATVAAVLLPDQNRASLATGARWRNDGGAF